MAYYNQFDPNSEEPFKISRTKIDLFMECPHCFYLDRRLGVARPSGPGFSLNSAVDALLKKEFDIHRTKNEKHPLMEKYGIDAVPFIHEKMEEWRENFKGVQVLHEPTNFLVFGAVDDVWVTPDGTLHVVDYKATSTQKEISLDDEYKQGYKKQAEVYQWIMRQMGFKVSDIAYFVFCNGLKDKKSFDGKLEFDLSIISYKGDDSWVEPALLEAKKVLESDQVPPHSDSCEYCSYLKNANLERNNKTVQLKLKQPKYIKPKVKK